MGDGQRWREGLVEDGDEPLVRLVRWTGPWAEDDPDANLKVDVAAYAGLEPLTTLTNLARNVDVPVGALVRYVLAKWASGGSEGLLEVGPSTVARLAATVAEAEAAGTDEARLAAYRVLREVVGWLEHGRVQADSTYPAGGGGPVRRTRVGAYGVITEGERILLVRVSALDHLDVGRWSLPGGGLDHGEPIEAGALREIREETGLDATLGDLLAVHAEHLPPERTPSGRDVHWVQIYFRATVPPGSEPEHEMDGSTDLARWVHRDELAELDLVSVARRGAALAGWG